MGLDPISSRISDCWAPDRWDAISRQRPALSLFLSGDGARRDAHSRNHLLAPNALMTQSDELAVTALSWTPSGPPINWREEALLVHTVSR